MKQHSPCVHLTNTFIIVSLAKYLLSIVYCTLASYIKYSALLLLRISHKHCIQLQACGFYFAYCHLFCRQFSFLQCVSIGGNKNSNTRTNNSNINFYNQPPRQMPWLSLLIDFYYFIKLWKLRQLLNSKSIIRTHLTTTKL